MGKKGKQIEVIWGTHFFVNEKNPTSFKWAFSLKRLFSLDPTASIHWASGWFWGRGAPSHTSQPVLTSQAAPDRGPISQPWATFVELRDGCSVILFWSLQHLPCLSLCDGTLTAMAGPAFTFGWDFSRIMNFFYLLCTIFKNQTNALCQTLRKYQKPAPRQNKIILQGVWSLAVFSSLLPVIKTDPIRPEEGPLLQTNLKKTLKSQWSGEIRQGRPLLIIMIRTILQNPIAPFLQNRRKVILICPTETAPIFLNGSFDLRCQAGFVWWVGWIFLSVESFYYSKTLSFVSWYWLVERLCRNASGSLNILGEWRQDWQGDIGGWGGQGWWMIVSFGWLIRFWWVIDPDYACWMSCDECIMQIMSLTVL